MMCRHMINVHGLRVPCGRCIACRLNYARDWAIRLRCEMEDYKFSDCCFATFTYDDDHLPLNSSISVSEVQRLIKRLRKIAPFRYFACGEYGDLTHRPHYHMAILGQGIFSKLFTDQTYYAKKKGFDVKCSAWDKGKIFLGDLTDDSANYVAGYMLKKVKGKQAKVVYDNNGLKAPFSLMSRKPGLGFNWCLKNADWLKERQALLFKGKPVPLPRYFIKLLFGDDELAALSYEKAVNDYIDPLIQVKNTDYSKMDIEHYDQFDRNVLAKNPMLRERF